MVSNGGESWRSFLQWKNRFFGHGTNDSNDECHLLIASLRSVLLRATVGLPLDPVGNSVRLALFYFIDEVSEAQRDYTSWTGSSL